MVDVRVLRTEDAPVRLLADARVLMDLAFDDFDDDDWHHGLGGWHVVAEEGAELLAHASVVARTLHVGDRPFATGYLEAVATRPERQGTGIGTLVLEGATAIVRASFELGGLGTGEHRFYERLGWERWQGPTYVRRSSGLDRSEEDDDGVMVLRFGPSAAIDLTGPIACEEREGDDW